MNSDAYAAGAEARPGFHKEEEFLETRFAGRTGKRKDDPGAQLDGHRLVQSPGSPVEKVWHLDRTENLIGRSRNCTIRITDTTVSAHHLLLVVRRDLCVLKDLNSKNGVLVNHAPVKDLVALKSGDEITVGNVQLAYYGGSEGNAAETVIVASPRRKTNRVFHLIVGAAAILGLFALAFGLSTQLYATSSDMLVDLKTRSEKYSPAFQKKTTEATVVTPEETAGHLDALDQTIAPFTAQYQAAPPSAVPVTEAMSKMENRRQMNAQNISSERKAAALQLYEQGDVEAALHILQSLSSKGTDAEKKNSQALMQRMSDARRFFDAGLAYYGKKAFALAFREWKKATLIDRELIPDGGGRYAGRIAGYLGDEYCRRARRRHEQGDQEQARRYCEIALKACPDHRGTQELLALIGARGETDYGRKD